MTIELTVGEQPVIPLRIDDDVGIDLGVTEQIVIEDHDTLPYRGEYEFTPTENVQTVRINGLRATRNITINPIPNNYGKITWNGSVLTVS